MDFNRLNGNFLKGYLTLKIEISMSISERIKNYLTKSREKHKLSFTNDTTYDEKWSFRLSSMNLWMLLTLYSFILVASVILIIKFTGLNAIFAGGENMVETAQVNENRTTIDSLKNQAASTQMYLDDLKRILLDQPFDDSLGSGSNDSIFRNYQASFQKSEEDSLLRLKVENEGKPKSNLEYDFFFAPVKGTISKSFNYQTRHFGVDIVTAAEEPVKACLEGTVIYASWTSDDGELIMVQHNNGFISVYKHCSSLLKKLGDRVQSGDPIGLVGTSGEHTSGPHLHFELWKSGVPLNPQDFINFNK